MKKYLLIIAWILAVVAPVSAQKVKLEPDQKYLLLSTRKTSTMQDEINEVAAQGFRIMVGSSTGGVEMVLLLERVAIPPEVFSYLLLATTKSSTMQKELTETAAKGFRLLPRTMISKEKTFSLVGEGEVVVFMERPPRPDKQYDYRLLATARTGTLQKEITEALADGYVLAGLVNHGEHMVIMEKESPTQ
ncbi:MAG: hypothetical protein HYS38_06410 [Acidobacteria bacterium]|nr:hypothetical protein [Acidobacteriota bacterium]